MIKKHTLPPPKISIIIPVYNTESYLRECLDSALNQTLKEIEVICTNDGSTDNSLKILREYAKKDPRVIVIDQENQGVSIARNSALKIAKGKYIHFLDSDDYLDLHAYEKLYQRAEQLSLDMLSFKGQNFQNGTKEFLPSPYYSFTYLPEGWNKEVFDYKDCKDFVHHMAVTTHLTFYRHDFITKHNITFPEHLCFEDNVFFTKAILNAKRCSILQEVLLYRRIHSASITQNWADHLGEYFNMADLVITYVKSFDESLLEQYKQHYLHGCIFFYKKYSFEYQIKLADNLVKILTKYEETDKCMEFLDICQTTYMQLRQTKDLMKYKESVTETYIKNAEEIFKIISIDSYGGFLAKVKDYALNYNASDKMFDFYLKNKREINVLLTDKVHDRKNNN